MMSEIDFHVLFGPANTLERTGDVLEMVHFSNLESDIFGDFGTFFTFLLVKLTAVAWRKWAQNIVLLALWVL